MTGTSTVEAREQLRQQMMEYGLQFAGLKNGPVEIVGGAQHAGIEVGDRWFGVGGMEQVEEPRPLLAELGLQLPAGEVNGVMYGAHAEQTETFDQVRIKAQRFEQGHRRLAQKGGDHVGGDGR